MKHFLIILPKTILFLTIIGLSLIESSCSKDDNGDSSNPSKLQLLTRHEWNIFIDEDDIIISFNRDNSYSYEGRKFSGKGTYIFQNDKLTLDKLGRGEKQFFVYSADTHRIQATMTDGSYISFWDFTDSSYVMNRIIGGWEKVSDSDYLKLEVTQSSISLYESYLREPLKLMVKANYSLDHNYLDLTNIEGEGLLSTRVPLRFNEDGSICLLEDNLTKIINGNGNMPSISSDSPYFEPLTSNLWIENINSREYKVYDFQKDSFNVVYTTYDGYSYDGFSSHGIRFWIDGLKVNFNYFNLVTFDIIPTGYSSINLKNGDNDLIQVYRDYQSNLIGEWNFSEDDESLEYDFFDDGTYVFWHYVSINNKFREIGTYKMSSLFNIKFHPTEYTDMDSYQMSDYTGEIKYSLSDIEMKTSLSRGIYHKKM